MSKKKIAIVTTGLEGLTRNNGVGVVSRAMAELLAREGHQVTILFTAVFSDADKDFHKWQKRFRKKGIELCCLKEPSLPPKVVFATKLSFAAYEFLSQRPFDIIHFEDLYGYGYYSMLAKRRKLAFASTTLCVTLHGPLFWHFYHNDMQVFGIDSLEFYFQEKKSVEWADACFAPSRYIVNWLSKQNWKLPDKIMIQKPPAAIPTKLKYRSRKKFDELVFFGRLEKRKGLDIFCEALEKIHLPQIKKITFLGRAGEIANRDAKDYIHEKTKNLPFKIRILNKLERTQALKYLCNSSALAVIPSRSETFGITLHECSELDIPFLASSIPAFREAVEDRSFLVPLTSAHWAEKISERVSFNTNVKLKSLNSAFWKRWHDSHKPRKSFNIKKGRLKVDERCFKNATDWDLPIVSDKRTYLF